MKNGIGRTFNKKALVPSSYGKHLSDRNHLMFAVGKPSGNWGFVFQRSKDDIGFRWKFEFDLKGHEERF